MAEGVGFEGSNSVMLAPESMGPDECYDLETFRDGKQVISCWRLSEEELAEVQRTGVVWLSIIGNGMPPVCVSGAALVTINGRPATAEPVLPRAPRQTGGSHER